MEFLRLGFLTEHSQVLAKEGYWNAFFSFFIIIIIILKSAAFFQKAWVYVIGNDTRQFMK